MSLHQRLSDHAAIGDAGRDSLFLLAEASTTPGLLGRLEFHAIEHQCLWYLEQNPGLEKHAPILFPLKPGSDLDTWLGTLDGSLAFTAFEATLPLEALAQHLRRFGKVQQGKQRYFLRLGDPRSLSLYVGSLAQHADTLARLFDHGRVLRLYFHDPATDLALGVQPLFEQAEDACEQEDYLAWLRPEREGGQ
ncbi:DUF4123 domain-containing protein [Pseudomonas guariconensis]|uniref:DUF4123 domain-containing protein n=1 Tax=Pseudomonas TaxID=286 RepID=UPI001CE45AAC|nr:MULTISPECIES: DUF4123 domain-containing protein [Pseudomonas]MCO7635140.1 DUF4123 domain-containing protein [Pseudomonas guariconensis]